MNELFHPISQQAAVADLAELPQRLAAGTHIKKGGTEGRNLRAQAKIQQRWHQLFHRMNRRATV